MHTSIKRVITGLALTTLIACTPTLPANVIRVAATSTADPPTGDTVTLTVDPPGALRWTRQFGTSSSDNAYAIATDANGNTYTSGFTFGALEGANAGGQDAFVRSYGR